MTVKAIIPNFLTSMNLVFGLLSMISTLNGNYEMAAICILLALVADGLDGRVARYFGVSGELGKEMDSLCDCVSFGAASAFLAYAYVMQSFGYIGILAMLIYGVCGMGRLARFNVNASIVHGYFMGVPIPAGGCFIATWVLLSSSLGYTPAMQVETFGWFLPVILMVLGYLLVSTFKYPDFKGKGEKVSKIAIALCVVIFLAVLYFARAAIGYAVLFDIFFTYVLLGVLNTIFSLGKNPA